MTQRGFALLAALWFIAALTVLAGAGIAVAHTGSSTTRNRVLLARAEWAREGCAEILQARYAADPGVRTVPAVDLGRGTWCRATLEDPATRLNINTVSPEALQLGLCAARVGCRNQSPLEDILAARRRAWLLDLRQLADVPGIDSAAVTRLRDVFTTRGSGAVNVATASPLVLRALPGLNEEAVSALVHGRSTVEPPRSIDALAARVSAGSRALLLARYADLARLVVFTPVELIATVEGGVDGTPIVARAVLTLIPVPGRLAVIQREVE